VRIGASAFHGCVLLEKASFPASLIVIEARAFGGCRGLQEITFAAGSRLQYIRSGAFSDCPLKEVVVPASIVEIEPSAFSGEVWRDSVKYEGPPLFLVDDHFIRSADSRVIVRSLSLKTKVFIESNTEVIGTNTFLWSPLFSVVFESGSRLREIGSKAFFSCSRLMAFTVPESVEIIGDHCFEGCLDMETIEFEGLSRLKMIGERAFSGCKLHSITIPALTEEIDGSAFVNCPLSKIQVAPGNANFTIEGSQLVTSDGTELVRYFGVDREILVGKKIQVLGKSCFEGCKRIVEIEFELGSELERIGAAALRDCESLWSIDIPASVIIIEESSFERCRELESCFIAKDSSLVTIGFRAFAKCSSLRSFFIPRLVEKIGRQCFAECIYLYRLKFLSSESLQRVIDERVLDDVLYEFGMTTSSCLFRIDIEGGDIELKFPGWVSVHNDDEDFEFSLFRDLQ
jgi:hypothetical protein